MTSRYEQIANDLRTRIGASEWPVGSRLPGLAALMDEYDAGLNTVRAAQQLLVREGMLRTEQGVGAWVTSTQSLRSVNVPEQLSLAADAIDRARSALESRRKGEVTITLTDDAYFVLTESLRDFVSEERGRLTDDGGSSQHLEVAESILDQIDQNL